MSSRRAVSCACGEVVVTDANVSSLELLALGLRWWSDALVEPSLEKVDVELGVSRPGWAADDVLVATTFTEVGWSSDVR
jgi:hypothetical protein